MLDKFFQQVEYYRLPGDYEIFGIWDKDLCKGENARLQRKGQGEGEGAMTHYKNENFNLFQSRKEAKNVFSEAERGVWNISTFQNMAQVSTSFDCSYQSEQENTTLFSKSDSDISIIAKKTHKKLMLIHTYDFRIFIFMIFIFLCYSGRYRKQAF